MARQKGSANFAGTLEVLAGGPIDARSRVPAVADLTASGSFPYPYVGMEVYVIAENKKYRLIGDDPTDSANWEEVGSGGGGGHTIYDDGTAMEERAGLDMVDFDLTDNETDDTTEVRPHRLTSEDMSEIMSTLPAAPTDLPVLFDERGTEYQVGWYVYADGTKKPVYEKTFIFSSDLTLSENSWTDTGISSTYVEKMIMGAVLDNSYNIWSNIGISHDSGTFRINYIRNVGTIICAIRIQYTKNTDTAS